jgi:hypothetical protein
MTIIFFEPFIIKHERCYARIGNKVIWNCESFLKLLDKDIILYETTFRPTYSNEPFISLGGWCFDISSTINHNARYNEVIEGWKLINIKDDKFVLDRIFQFFFMQLVIDATSTSTAEFSKHEPLIAELLRLSYWYYKCYKSLGALEDISPSKRKEIRDKLFGRLLRKIEGYKTTIKMEEAYPDEKEAFIKKANENIKSAKAAKKIDEQFINFVNELFVAVWSVTSELMFAGILSENAHKLDFDKKYDFTLDHIPCQVKSIIPSESSFKETSNRVSHRTYELNNGKIIDETEVRKEIISLLQEKHNLIDDAIKQGGRIVCVNGTQTYAGYLLNRWASDNPKISLTADRSLSSSASLLKEEQSISILREEEKFLPLIFGASAIDTNYRFSTMTFRMPVKLMLDDRSLDKIEYIESSLT